MAEGNKQWYVLRVVSGKELKVKEAFEKACSIYDNLKENLEQGFQQKRCMSPEPEKRS